MIARHRGLLPLLLTVYATVPDSKLEREKEGQRDRGKEVRKQKRKREERV